MSLRSSGLLVIILLVVYNANLRQVSSYDTYASRFVPLSILRDGDLVLDEFVPDRVKRQAGPDFFSNYFAFAKGHFFDSHPPVGPILALPVYVFPAWTGIPGDAELAANLYSKLAASMMAALSALLVFAASRRVLVVFGLHHDTCNRAALLASIAYGLGTPVWSTASLAMWTHTPAVLGYAAAIWALIAGLPVTAGIAAAAAVIARPATAPAAALLALYLVHRVRVRFREDREALHASVTDALRFAGAAALVGIAGATYNLWLFGNVVGGAPARTQYWVNELGTAGMFSGSLLAGLAGLTISPSRGIFIFSPVIVVAILGAVRVWRTRLSEHVTQRGDTLLLARYASVAAIAILLTYSKFIVWWGGHGYGPRYLTDAMPFVGILLAFGFLPGDALGRSASWRRTPIVAIALLVCSIGVQAIGAFCWPSPWTLSGNPPYRYRLWNWRDNEIASCLRAGPRFDPAGRRLLGYFGISRQP